MHEPGEVDPVWASEVARDVEMFIRVRNDRLDAVYAGRPRNAAPEGALFLARVDKLLDLGALEPESRKGSGGLPPLKLVTPDEDDDVAAVPEPRITSKPLDIAAQRLREIAATKDASEEDDKTVDFVDFLEQQGVTDLGDKLEAAAAYLTFVDGEPDFTRPQLMRLVQSASRDEITREDGLRCFGRLLRQSRFAKLNNGRFKVDDNTPFRPRNSRVAQG